MMMNCFYGMVNQQKAFTLYFQPGPLSEILTIATLRAGFEPAQNPSLDFVEGRCVSLLRQIYNIELFPATS